LNDQQKKDHFQKTIWPHLNAAYNLARWLARRESDAEDIVQESFARAFRSMNQQRGENPKAWFLTIVRHTAYTWLRQHRSHEWTDEASLEHAVDPGHTPEALALQKADHALLATYLETLPLEFREVLVLRELEELSYKEICEVTALPMGTVMSRLSRARDRLEEALREHRRNSIHDV
jgi:RNA polymerase sigma-70 factor, ECF subfamily